MNPFSITKISMRILSKEETVPNGVIAYASIVFNDSVKINGLALTENENGKHIVRFPESEDKKLQYIVPLNDELRKSVDRAVVEHYFKLKNKLNRLAKK